MASGYDREDRAAAAKAEVAAAERKRKKKVVKKKAPPLPVPSLTIAYETKPEAPTRPGRRVASSDPVVKTKPKPHGGHLPTQFEFLSPEQFGARALGVETDEEKRESRQRNQWRERERRDTSRAKRAALKAERERRRAAIRKLPREARKMIGQDRIRDFVMEGRPLQDPGVLDYAGAIAKGIASGAKGIGERAPDYFGGLASSGRTSLQYGLRGRETGREMDIQDDPVFKAFGDIVLGPNVIKAAKGEDFDPHWLAAELGLMFVPIKGLPTPITAALRALVGAQRLAAGERAGLTVAEIAQTLTKPISEVKAARRLRIAGEAARGERRASSWVAKTLSGDSNSFVARVIRNDPSARRAYTDGDGVMETGYALSRTGKAAQKIIDRYRAGLSKTRVVKDERSKYAELLVHRADVAARQYEALAASLPRFMPRDMLHRIDWPAVYATRSVLKGVPVSDEIVRTEADLARALADGETLRALALQHHLAYFRAAEPMVRETDDAVEFSEQASDAAREFADMMTQAGEAREEILSGLGLLDQATAQARVLNEQLYYQTGKLLPQGDAVDQAIRSNPVFKEAERVFKQQNPKTADHALTVYAANARRWYEGQISLMQTKVDQIKEALEADPGSNMAERWRATIADFEQRIKDLKPDAYFDQALSGGVKGELPAKVIETESETFGALGEDWFFSLHGEPGEISAASKAIAKEIRTQGLKLPHELDTEEKLAAGIEKVFEMAREGESGKDWYKTAANGVKVVSDHTGVPQKQVAQLFAIFSQAADTVSNATFVFDAINQYRKYGDVFAGRFPVRQSEEALAVLRGGTWNGRKRSSFYANMLRHIPGMEDEYAATLKEMAADRGSETNPVTVDRWVVRMFSESLGDVPGSYYDSFEKIMQGMAKHLGWEPEQIQAAAWVTMKDRALQAELASSGRETVRHKAGAPDAFEFGINRQLEKEAQGSLFGEASGDVRPQAKRLANAANKKWGGFTVDRDLNAVPEEGYSVTVSLTEEAFPLHKLTGADIEQFLARHADVFKDKRFKLGGFSDDANEAGDGTEVTYLSATRHFKRKGDALKYAREQGQETVYEYKTGDGIRTGLSRDEQARIIDGLRAEAEAANPRVALPPRIVQTNAEKEYDDFLAKAALDMLITKAGKKPTVSQKARAEEWMIQHGHEYPDEPLMQEFDRLYAQRPKPEEPAWMLENVMNDQTTRFALGGSDVGDDVAEQIVGRRGDDIAHLVPGWDEAYEALKQGIVPREFVDFVTQSSMPLYEKYAVGRAMDRVLRRAGHEKLSGRPGTEELGWLPNKLKLGGMFASDTNTIYLSPDSRVVDGIHELMHANEFNEMFPQGLRAEMWKFVGADPMQARLTEQQSEDMVDLFEAMLLGYDDNASHLPPVVKKAFQAISDDMNLAGEDKYRRARAMLAKMPEDFRLRMEDTFWYLETTGRKGRYVPEVPGLPFSFKDTVLGVQRYPALYRRARANSRVTALTPTDKALEKSFTGALLQSGLWDRDVTRGTMGGLIKAIEIQKMHTLREGLLATGKDIPDSIYDVAVPIDPKAFAKDKSKAELGSLFRLFDVMDSGAKVTEQELDKVTLQGIDQAKDFFFPGMSDGTARAVQEIAEEVMERAQPIEGVKWVKRDMLEKVHLFEPQAYSTQLKGTTRGKALSTVDFANNIAKNYTLTWNPAYYFMNMSGMGIMSLSQQGAFAPITLLRGLVGMKDLGNDVHLIDLFAGQGLASVVHTGQQGALGKFTNAGAKASEILIDRYPRRAAFLFEARRLGYKSNEQVRSLMLDPTNIDDLVLVSRRANRAMVDFGRMGRFEKEFVTRAIFVYPWLKGSTKYALNFPLDHPVQTALFATLLAWQQQRLRDQFPEGQPGYLKWYLPIKEATGGEPGQTPYGFRMDQLFTPLQTLDLAAEIAFWVAPGKWDMPWGSNEESMVTKMNPLYEEVLKTITGWDSFEQKEVSKGWDDLMRRLADPRERWATWDRLKRVLEGKTHEGIYDTTQTQNWLRVFMGSLAPINVDPVAAGERAQPTRTITIEDKSDEQRLDEWVQDATRLSGEAPPPNVVELKRADMAYDDVYAEYRREQDIDTGLTPQETLIVLVRTMAKLHPEKQADAERLEEKAKTMSDDEAEDAIEEGREKMGLTAFGRLDDKLSEAREKERVGS